MLLLSADCFHYKLFKNNSLRECQTDCLLVLIWVQSICKGYQQMTKVSASKERVNRIQIRKAPVYSFKISKYLNPFPANIFMSWKCSLLITPAAYIQMHFRVFLPWIKLQSKHYEPWLRKQAVCFDFLHLSQEFFSHVRMGLPGLNQY